MGTPWALQDQESSKPPTAFLRVEGLLILWPGAGRTADLPIFRIKAHRPHGCAEHERVWPGVMQPVLDGAGREQLRRN